MSSFRLAFLLFPFRFDYKQDKTNDGAVKTRELLVELMSVISHSSVKNLLNNDEKCDLRIKNNFDHLSSCLFKPFHG